MHLNMAAFVDELEKIALAGGVAQALKGMSLGRAAALSGGIGGATIGGVTGAIGAGEGKRMKGFLGGAATGAAVGAGLGAAQSRHLLKHVNPRLGKAPIKTVGDLVQTQKVAPTALRLGQESASKSVGGRILRSGAALPIAAGTTAGLAGATMRDPYARYY